MVLVIIFFGEFSAEIIFDQISVGKLAMWLNTAISITIHLYLI